jgi:hypothetical protein
VDVDTRPRRIALAHREALRLVLSVLVLVM